MKIIALTGAGISKDSGIPTFEEFGDKRYMLSREFATNHPLEYERFLEELIGFVSTAKPNDAHYALAEYQIPIITLNIDEFHYKAGSKNVLEIHGRLPQNPHNASLLYNSPVLYGDLAPTYKDAINLVDTLGDGDVLLVVGASGFTGIAQELRELAYINGAEVIEIQDDAQHLVRDFLEQTIGPLDDRD